jgi:hypothetical protein
MWRSILAVILLPALTAAQSEPIPTAPTGASNPPSVAAVRDPGPKYQSYTFYDGIRRGREEEVVIHVSVHGFVTTPKSPVQGVVPLKLDLDPADGLALSVLRYPKGQLRNLKSQSQPVPVAGQPDIRFKIKADRNAALGPHVLKGKITFQALPYAGSTPGPVQQIEVQIPITVVEHDAKVQKQPWPIHHTPVALIVVLIILLPLLIPLMLPIYLICAAEGEPGCG